VHLINRFKLVALLLGGVIIATTSNFSAALKDWERLENCQLVPSSANDGDSFHVRCKGTEYVVRLYMVDAPETKSVSPERLIEQAQYFGIDVPHVIEVGKQATSFVQKELSEPFTVITRRASGMGRSDIQRFYAFVQTKTGRDLGELLVANGLARVHGTHAAPPGIASAADEVQKLEELAQRAKAQNRGGWSVTTATTSAGATPNQPPRAISPAPARAAPLVTIATPSGSAASPAPNPVVRKSPDSATNQKLDVNTASKEQLQELPGIGETFADRIIAARPFKSADELKKVKGIGSGKRYEELRSFFR
jgi:DNA uptake protein ComE-like DNA-binding protein